MFSCAGHHSLDYINKSIISIADNLVQRPLIFVGGKILDLEPAIKDKVAADAFTNDIELVISKVRTYRSGRISPKNNKRS